MNTMKPAPYYVKALAMAIPAILIGIQIPTWLTFIPSRGVELQADFRVLYTAGYMARTGQRLGLYNYPLVREVQARVIANDNAAVPFIHPAFETLIFAPLSLLSYRAAYLVWILINCVLLGLTGWLLRPRVDALGELLPWLPAASLPSFFPISFVIMQGQDSLLLLLVLLLAYRKIADHELIAGLLLGLGLFRYQVLLPLLVLLLWWRAWKLILGCFVTSCGLMALSVAIAGISGQVQYFHILQALAATPYLELTKRMVNIRGFVTSLGGGVPVTAVLSAIVMVAAAWRGAKQTVEQRFLLSISVSSLVAYHFFLHDLCILILPLLIALNRDLAKREWKNLAVVSLVFSLPTVVWFANGSIYIMALGTLVLLLQQMMMGVEIVPHSAKNGT